MAKGTCSIDGCERVIEARGWCHRHYTRWRKYGDPLRTKITVDETRPRIHGDDEARFLSKIDMNGPIAKNYPELGCCWISLAQPDKNGYGRFYWRQDTTPKSRSACVFAYRRWIGPIPEGLVLDHFACDNGPGGCVNPWHLRPETIGDNVLRGDTPSGINSRKTHCLRGHPLWGDNLYVPPGTTHRGCRICIKRRNDARYRKG